MATKPLRKIRVVGNVAYVPLTKGYSAIIDADDVKLVSMFSWHASVRSRQVYAVANSCDDSGNRIAIYLHRVIMSAPNGLDVDHISGDGLDNRKKNLRIATRMQNIQNKRKCRGNKSGFKGVHKQNGKWRAMICCNGKTYSLGLYHTAKDASEAYRAASLKLHGEFGRAS